MTVFTPSIPAAGHTLATDQPLMLANFTYLNASLGVDHNVTENTSGTNDGYHTDIHLIPQSAPSQIAGIGQLWAETIDGDQELYYQSGNGIISQLTAANITPSPNPNGYSYLPGGIIIQWGFKNGTHSGGQHTFSAGDSGSITFPIPFTSAVFTINANLSYNSTTAGTPSSGSGEVVAFDTSTLSSLTGATYFIAGSGGSYTRFFWTAIGI